MIWIMLGGGVVVLLIAAISKRNNERCSGIDINITGVQNNFFIDKKDVLRVLEQTNGGILENKALHKIDIDAMENELRKNQWINEAQLYFDNNDILRVSIKEREPIARVFTLSGQSFYIDSSLTRLSLSDKFSPRLPVFTSFPTDAIVWSNHDSTLIADVRTLSEFIALNPFWMAQIDQVDITSKRQFDLIPKLGNVVIHFGDANDCKQKFDKLLCFYKQVLTKIGWNHYAAIDAQFKGQVVGVRKDAGEIKADSLKSVQIMKQMIEDAQKQANDSTKVQLDQGADDNNDINTSHDTESVPNEDVDKKENKEGSVTPIHVPEKPKSLGENSLKSQTPSNHSTSDEKPNPTPLKAKTVKPTNIQNEQTGQKIPKAIMPPKLKTDY